MIANSGVQVLPHIPKGDRQDFFGHVGTPRDRPTSSPEVVFASYDDSPPRPAKTLEVLLALRSEASPVAQAER